MPAFQSGASHPEQVAKLKRLWNEAGADAALAAAEQAAQANPQDRVLQLVWLEALIGHQRHAEANALAASFDRFDPSGLLRLSNQAAIAEASGQLATAIDLLEQAETRQPSLQHRIRLLNLAGRLGDAKRGLFWAKQTRRMAKDSAERLVIACTETGWRIQARDFIGAQRLALLTIQGLIDAGALQKAAPNQPIPPPADHATKLRQTLAAALERLEGAGQRPLVVAGLLLGWQRDNAFLPGDKDIDLALPPGDDFAAAQATLGQDSRFRREPNPLLLQDFITYTDLATGIQVDIVAHRAANLAGESCFLGGSRMAGLPDAECRLLRHSPYRLVRDQWQGLTLWRAEDTDGMLREYYGTWRQRDPYFDSMIGAPAMLGFPEYVRALAYFRLLLAVQAGHMAKAVALARQIAQRDADDVLADWFLHQIEGAV